MLTAQKLRQIQEVVNLRQLCASAGVSYQSIYAKLQRGSDLKVGESQLLEEALKTYGLTLYEPMRPAPREFQ